MQLPTTIAVMSPKGGTGKSTTLTALALYLARAGKKVLAVDLDNIGSLTNNLSGGPNSRDKDASTVFDLFRKTEEIEDIKVSTVTENLHLIQGDKRISEINRTNSLSIVTQLEMNLKARVPNINQYDYIAIDTPAGDGNTVLSALLFCNFIYSPIDLDQNSISALDVLTDMLRPIKIRMNPNLRYLGFVINRVQKLVKVLGRKVPEALSERQIYNELVERHGDNALLGVIAFRTPIKSSISKGHWIKGNDSSAQEAESELEHFCQKLLEQMELSK